MTLYAIDVTCPQCSGPVEYLNSTTSGLLAVTILACEPCARQWEVDLRLTVHRTPEQRRDAEKTARRRARQRVMA